MTAVLAFLGRAFHHLIFGEPVARWTDDYPISHVKVTDDDALIADLEACSSDEEFRAFLGEQP